MKEKLELRMYFCVPYNISDIQKGIQAGHAALEYERLHGDTELYKDFVKNYKTWIILNGGTTNSSLIKNPETGWYADPEKDESPYLGSLDNIVHQLISNEVDMSIFREPDLNDALTAICFIADERVFNYANYPDFANWLMEIKMYPDFYAIMADESKVLLRNLTPNQCEEAFPTWYKEWIEFLGGDKNVFLRELLRDKKLA